MAFSPADPTLSPWGRLSEALGGSLSARPRGLVAPEFVLLDRDGREFGKMSVRGRGGARIEAGPLGARIERLAGPDRYHVLTARAETLLADRGGTSVIMKIRCGGRSYEASFDLLRNTASALSAGGVRTARLEGGILTRRYRALFDVEDACSLPIALFLLYRTVALRRRALLAGPAAWSERPAGRPRTAAGAGLQG